MNYNEDIRVIIVEDNEQIGTISLESMLKGDKGDKGDTGDKGDKGNKGDKGDDYVITQQDYQNIANIVEQQVDIPTALSQLTDDSTHRTVTDTEKTTWNNKGTYSKPENGIPKTDLDSSVQTSLGKADTALQEHQDISMKQNIEDNTLTTNNKTVPSAINEVNSIAKGANQALSYGNYSTMVTAFNSLDDDVYNIGQNIYIITTEVPDLWISSVESTSSTYTYVDDATIVSALETNGYIQVGYYKLSMLETQKVDLTDYVKNTDYATSSKGGVFKTSNSFATDVTNGYLNAQGKTYTQYTSLNNNAFISKQTLENVITGKGLVSNTDYANRNTAGVVKVTEETYGLAISINTGNIFARVENYSDYLTKNNYYVIGKGTLENVITGKNLETANNKTTSISSSSTDTQYPSAKAVYDRTPKIVVITESEYNNLLSHEDNTEYHIIEG